MQPPAAPAADVPCLLLAGGDAAFDAAAAEALARSGFRCERVRDDEAFAAALRRRTWAAVLLAAPLDPARALQRVQAAQPATLALLLLPPADAAGRVRWLDQGADDLLALPADPAELAARVRALLRRTRCAHAAAVVLRHGPLRLETERRVATWHGREVALTHREFWLLETLLRRPHEVVPRAVLEQTLGGWSEEANSNTLEVHVHHLRRKIDPRLIVTERGSGYRLGAAEALAG